MLVPRQLLLVEPVVRVRAGHVWLPMRAPVPRRCGIGAMLGMGIVAGESVKENHITRNAQNMTAMTALDGSLVSVAQACSAVLYATTSRRSPRLRRIDVKSFKTER